MARIILRIQHPKGMTRIEIDQSSSLQNLMEEMQKKTDIDPSIMIISFDGSKFTKFSPKSTLLQYKEFYDGAILYLRASGEKSQDTKKLPEPPKQALSKNCNHGINGRCLNCNSVKSEIKEEKTNEKPSKNNCQHGPNGKCINCFQELDQSSENYVKKKSIGKCDHGPNAKCLNCLVIENVNTKHLSFDYFIDKNYAKCTNHSEDQKCNNCLVDLEFDYKIKKDCPNHEPYPKGMCSKCVPPLIKMKRQQYRHVDYTQFMNVSETQNFIQYWLKSLNQRVGILYGYYAEDPIYDKGVRAVIEAVYEPPQENHFNDSIILQDPFQ